MPHVTLFLVAGLVTASAAGGHVVAADLLSWHTTVPKGGVCVVHFREQLANYLRWSSLTQSLILPTDDGPVNSKFALEIAGAAISGVTVDVTGLNKEKIISAWQTISTNFGARGPYAKLPTLLRIHGGRAVSEQYNDHDIAAFVKGPGRRFVTIYEMLIQKGGVEVVSKAVLEAKQVVLDHPKFAVPIILSGSIVGILLGWLVGGLSAKSPIEAKDDDAAPAAPAVRKVGRPASRGRSSTASTDLSPARRTSTRLRSRSRSRSPSRHVAEKK